MGWAPNDATESMRREHDLATSLLDPQLLLKIGGSLRTSMWRCCGRLQYDGRNVEKTEQKPVWHTFFLIPVIKQHAHSYG